VPVKLQTGIPLRFLLFSIFTLDAWLLILALFFQINFRDSILSFRFGDSYKKYIAAYQYAR